MFDKYPYSLKLRAIMSSSVISQFLNRNVFRIIAYVVRNCDSSFFDLSVKKVVINIYRYTTTVTNILKKLTWTACDQKWKCNT